MPTTTVRVQVPTDANGYFHKTEKFNPPGPFNLQIELRAALVGPPAARVEGQLDIDGADGSPSNQAKAFVISTGEKANLGTWKLAGGDNIVVVSGRTEPKLPHSMLIVDLEAVI